MSKRLTGFEEWLDDSLYRLGQFFPWWVREVIRWAFLVVMAIGLVAILRGCYLLAQ